MLHVGAARVKVTSLPASFPRDSKNNHPYNDHRYLLATASAGGNPVVLVADIDKISGLEQSKHTKMWKSRPQVVIENEMILGFNDGGLAELIEKERRWLNRKHVPELLWFGERSGVVLIRIHGFCFLCLDLHSKKIVRCFCSDRRMQYAK
ncbi:unnamed protein product [Miscanthus lutarioriparius]|uniref:Uncharacterized protein n=1 Tax=Miscanthus lutarioriparius TaxID=422564 RepID=A0A811NK28_9POAL|nr:unnamed protein product [Miscanthus lutarioriparius]